MLSFKRAIVVLIPLALMLTWAAPALGQGGPVVLMNIDAEDANDAINNLHGGKQPYQDVLTDILSNVTNGGSGILVIGGGKSANDDVTEFWNIVGAGAVPSQTVTHVNGFTNITNQLFAGFAVIAVASNTPETFSGGLTQAENNALAGRSTDIAIHVNNGGGLFGLTQNNMSNKYAYLAGIGAITIQGESYSDITGTAAGFAVGIDSPAGNLDVCCWHDTYTTFPSFLNVLAVRAGTGRAAAIGGEKVILPGQISFDDASQLAFNEPGTDHTVTVSVLDDDDNPIVGVDVEFDVVAGPNSGVMDTVATDGSGVASFTYTSNGGIGVDEIEACFDDPNDDPDLGDICTTFTARKFWDDDCNDNGIPDTCDIDCNGFGGDCNEFLGCGGSLDLDGNGQPDECNLPPDCSGAFASLGELWPPNHKFISVFVDGVTDPDGDPISITITAIFQDEPVMGRGDGNTCPDGMGVGESSAAVRKERSGRLNGRVYHIFFLAEDGQGGECEGSVTVCVPHDQRTGHLCVDEGPLFDSTDCGG